MANKSVIEISVLDEKFKAFAAAFEKYQKALKSMPADWNKVNAAAGSASSTLEENVEKIVKLLEEAGKKSEAFNKKIKDGSGGLKEAAKTTGEIARNLASGAFSIAKWMTLGALGSGFGLGTLASSAGNQRKTAQGLGVSTGDLAAANVNFGKYINPEATLGKIADIQQDLARRPLLNRLAGHNVSGQSSTEMLPDVIAGAVKQFKAGGGTKQYAEANKLTDILDFQELRRLSSLSEEELKKTVSEYQKDRKALAVNPETMRGWQEFQTQLGRSGQLIENSFIKNLGALTPQLKELSAIISTAIDNFLKSDQFKEMVVALGNGIKDFISYIGSPEAKEDLQSFMDGMKTLSETIQDIIGFLPTKSNNVKGSENAVKGDWYEASKTMGASAFLSAGANKLTGGLIGTSAQQSLLTDLEVKNKLPKGLLDSIWAAESSRGANKGKSSAGAEGDFQFMPSTQKEYGITNPQDFAQEADAAARKFKNLLKYYKQDTSKAIAAYNWGEGNLDKDIKAHGDKWKDYLPKETAGYLQKNQGVIVNINNNTGGSVVASANALPGGAQ